MDLLTWIKKNSDCYQCSSEYKITVRYSVSKMTAREIVKILKARGIVYSAYQKTLITRRILSQHKMYLSIPWEKIL